MCCPFKPKNVQLDVQLDVQLEAQLEVELRVLQIAVYSTQIAMIT